VSVWLVPGYTEGPAIGRGAAGVVRVATHDATGQPVAVKYLSDVLLADDGFRAGFRHEAELLGRIDAPNVVRLYEYVESSSGAAIVMELVEGVSLRAMLEQQGPTEPESALSVLKGSLTGLGAAHTVGIVHRDFKPANVLVDTSGQSKLTDFGIAARAGGGGAEGGTPLYMAPEQWRGSPPEPRGDIYSATATFVECLTGRPPFEAPNLDLLRMQHEQAPVPVDELPEPVRGIALRGMAKDPSQRPADVFAFVAELCVAAGAAYGEDWEERGRKDLAKRAALLALLFPLLAGGLSGGTAIASTTLGGTIDRVLRRNRVPLAVGIATVLAISGGALALGPNAPQPQGPMVEPAGTAEPPQSPFGPAFGPNGPPEGGLPPAQPAPPAVLPAPAQPPGPGPVQPPAPAVQPPPAGPVPVDNEDIEPEHKSENDEGDSNRKYESRQKDNPWKDSAGKGNTERSKRPPRPSDEPDHTDGPIGGSRGGSNSDSGGGGGGGDPDHTGTSDGTRNPDHTGTSDGTRNPDRSGTGTSDGSGTSGSSSSGSSGFDTVKPSG
jgi:serine/threonine-protein kinase